MLLIAGMCAHLAWLVSRSRATAALAAAVFLAFLSSFRFGRPYLTSAPETFWLSLPMWWLVWRCLRPASDAKGVGANMPGWMLSAAFGLALGLGAAYKSFALIVPACAVFWLALVWLAWPLRLPTLAGVTARVTLTGLVAFGVFGLWFALDPDPAAIWREFVVGENAGKMGQGSGYWRAALWGSSSIWVQALAYLQNAGLLAFPVAALGVFGLESRRAGAGALLKSEQTTIPAWLKVLLAWLLVWQVVFCIPSTRSARYVIPAMPALAVLLAVFWDRLGRGWFVATLVLAALALLGLGRIAWVMADLGIADGLTASVAAVVFLAGAGCVLLGLLKQSAARHAALGACLLVFAGFNATVAALETGAGRFTSPAAQQLRGASVVVPSGFNGQFERYEFLLPGNRIIPYTALDAKSAPAALPSLLAKGDALVWTQQEREAPPPCTPGVCTVLDSRWDIQGRHQSGDVTLANVWYPQLWLLRREWLLKPG
jgi:4-amino-4-deoxy-L-arabinose transferase-like glycosyltransferase